MPRAQTPYGIIPRPEFVITDKILETIQTEAARGLTLSQIASILGIAPATLYDKRTKYPSVENAYQVGHGIAIAKVESAIFRNATEPALGKDGIPTGPPAGNVDAQKFILKSRAGYKENDTPQILIQHNALFPIQAAPLIDSFLGEPSAIESANGKTESGS